MLDFNEITAWFWKTRSISEDNLIEMLSKEVFQYNLLTEVLNSAKSFLESHPDESIEEALEFGMNEWDV